MTTTRYPFSSTLHRIAIAGVAGAIGITTLAGTAFSAQAAAPVMPASAGKPLASLQGQQAVDRLNVRTGEAARKAGMSTEDLRRKLIADPAFRVDDDLNALYVEARPSNADLDRSAVKAAVAAPLPYSTDNTFKLHSRPSSTKKIYLDFNGHQLSGTGWNTSYTGGRAVALAPFNAEGTASSWSAAEHAAIQNVFLSVREDFASLDVDVTTEDPGVEALRKADAADVNHGTRVVITPTMFLDCGCGGIGYIGSFDGTVDTPAFVFTDSSNREKFVAEAASHEVGHTLGLHHDGLTDGTTYYTGHGDWAPIMGVGYGKTITQWSKGEYLGASNKEDDFSVMATNGLVAAADDHLGTNATTSTLPAGTRRYGVIGTGKDVDVFKFSVSGTRTIKIDAGVEGNVNYADLNLRAVLRDSAGVIKATANPSNTLGTTFTVTIPAGLYYLSLDGVGQGTVASTGYGTYASSGRYVVVLNWA